MATTITAKDVKSLGRGLPKGGGCPKASPRASRFNSPQPHQEVPERRSVPPSKSSSKSYIIPCFVEGHRFWTGAIQFLASLVDGRWLVRMGARAGNALQLRKQTCG